MNGAASFTYDTADMIALQRAWWAGAVQWRSILLTFLVLVGIYLALFVGMEFLDTGHVDLSGAGFVIGLALVVTVAIFGVGLIMAPFLGRRALRQNKLLGGEFHWRWSAEGLHVAHPRGHMDIPWDLLAGWLDAPEVMLFYQSKRLVFALPKRALAPADVAEIVALARAAGAPERKRFGIVAAPSA